MKKTFLLALALIMVAGCAFLVTSCGDEPVELAAPVVTLEGDVAKWQADANATKLEISIDGSLSYLESTVTSKKLEDGQSFKVRAIGDGELYTDSAWSNTVTYTAPVQGGDETTYTVTWKNGDVVLETDTGVKAGSTPTYDGEMPTKAADAEFTYTFKGWSPEISPVTGNITYVAQFDKAQIGQATYTVIWKNGDTVLEIDAGVEAGTIPTYDGATPTKAADAQYTYAFKGWSPEISPITGNVIYEAQFDKAPTIQTTYTVIWKNGDTVLETDTGVSVGTMPTYDGATPTKMADAQYTYTFNGWSPEISPVTGDATYVAQFENTVNKYDVTFFSEDGTVVLYTTTVEYGDTAVYRGISLNKNPEETEEYVFDKWLTEVGGSKEAILTNISENKNVYASYTAVVTVYTVTFKDWNGDVIKTETVVRGEGAVAPADPTLTGYSFTGWDKSFGIVESDLTVTATYIAKKYTVTFLMPNGTVLYKETVEYGFAVKAPTPPKVILDSKNGSMQVYSFTEWDKSFDRITEDTTVTAVYNSEYDGAIVIVDADTATNKATVYVMKNRDKLLYAIEIKAAYKTDSGNITIDSIDTNTAGIFSIDDNESETLDYVKNNNEKLLSIIWSNINGEIFDYIDRVLTISFGTSGNANIEHSFVIVECNAVLGDEGAENLEQVEAVVIYR